jgi:DNA-directed RNA polymerase subunit RPC12/RpoP
MKCGEEFDSLIQADMHRDECGGRVFDAKRKEEPKDEGKLTWRPPTIL